MFCFQQLTLDVSVIKIIKTGSLIMIHLLRLTLLPCLNFFFFFPDESNLKMNSVDHVPQTLASHIRLPEVSPPQGLEGGGSMQHGADMLKPDPRDTFYSSKSASHHFQAVPLFLSSSLLSCYHFPSTD